MRRNNKERRGIRSNFRAFNLKRNLSGMADNKAEAFLTIDQAVDILNMHATSEGSWSADDIGYTVLNQNHTALEGGARIDGVFRCRDANKTEHLYVAANSKLIEMNQTTGVSTVRDGTAGYALGSAVDAETFNNIFYTVDGNRSKPRKYDPVTATASDAPNWPLTDGGANTYSKPAFVELHQGRLVFLRFEGGTGEKTAYRNAIAVTNLDDGDTVTVTGSGADGGLIQTIGSSDTDIVGAMRIPVPLSNDTHLIIFKQDSTFALLGIAPLPGVINQEPYLVEINGSYGAFNNRCIVKVGSDVLALNTFGVIAFSSAANNGTVQPIAIGSDSIKKTIKRINANAESKAWAEHLPDRREVWFHVPTGGSSECNETLIYKYPTPGTQEIPKWSRRKSAGGKFICTHGCLIGKTFYIGLDTGHIGVMFTSSQYDGIGIPWKYEYPYWDIGNEQQNKRYAFGQAHFKVRTSQLVTLKTRWLGGGDNTQLSQQLDVGNETLNALYGNAVYGGASYGSAQELKSRYEVLGDGTRIKHTLSGVTGASGPEFLGLTPYMEIGGPATAWN